MTNCVDQPGTRTRGRATISSTSAWVLRMCALFDAPKTIASMLGCSKIHSIASPGGIAPEANTDIATARNSCFSNDISVGFDPATHPEPDLVDVRAYEWILQSDHLESIQEHGQVHRNEARLSVVPLLYMIGKNLEGVIKLKAQQEVDDNILQPDHRRRQTAEHRHLGINQEGNDAFNVFLRERLSSTDSGIQEALVGQEFPEGSQYSGLGDGVGVLVRVGHTRVEG